MFALDGGDWDGDKAPLLTSARARERPSSSPAFSATTAWRCLGRVRPGPCCCCSSLPLPVALGPLMPVGNARREADDAAGKARRTPFSAEELTTLVALAQHGGRQLFAAQDEALRA